MENDLMFILICWNCWELDSGHSSSKTPPCNLHMTLHTKRLVIFQLARVACSRIPVSGHHFSANHYQGHHWYQPAAINSNHWLATRECFQSNLVTGFLPRIYRSVRVFCHIFIHVCVIPYIVLIYGNLSKWQNTRHFLKLWRSDGNFSGALAESHNQYVLLLIFFGALWGHM